MKFLPIDKRLSAAQMPGSLWATTRRPCYASGGRSGARSSPAIFIRTREAHLDHEQAKAELKGLVPEDAKEAIGHGVRAKRSKSGAISPDLLSTVTEEASHAAV